LIGGVIPFTPLAQTCKLDRSIFILLYGSSYWNELINFEALVRYGVISREDLDLFKFADDPDTALTLLKAAVSLKVEESPPAFANRSPQLNLRRDCKTGSGHADHL
jgi:predicted Rossmann-fold nucleotide-binding protein